MDKNNLQKRFLQKAIQIWGKNVLDFNKVKYKHSQIKVSLICKIHNIEFEQTPDGIIKHNYGCPICKSNNLKARAHRKTTEEFIKQAIKIHGNIYSYIKTNYVSGSDKVEIICKNHGSFFVRPNHHLCKKSGCPKCKKPDTEKIIVKAKKLFGEIYDYSKVNYTGCYNKIEVICKKHGSFFVIPGNHLWGSGCPICKNSKGEVFIRRYLIEHEIKFIQNMTFPDCKYKRRLKFDFYLPKQNILIEFDGQQHVTGKYYNYPKNELIFIRDEIKNNYANQHNIKLIRIPYKYKYKLDVILNDLLNRNE